MPQQEKEFSLKDYFVPLTTLKAVHFIIIIGLVVYFNSLFNGFVGDDWGQIIDNKIIHSLKNISYFFSGSTFYIEGAGSFGLYYKPIMMLIYSTTYSLFGPNAFFYHLIQLLFHIASSSLLFIFLEAFFKRKLAFILAVIFLIHPINAESVLYIANMQEVLYFFFGIIALLILQKSNSLKSSYLVGVFGLLSILSKETGILFLLILLAYTYIFKKAKYNYFTLGVTIGIYFLLRLTTIGINVEHQDTYLLSNSNSLERLYSIPKIIFFYFSTFFFPKDLAIAQHWVVKTPQLGSFYIPLAIDVFIFVIAIASAIKLYIKDKKIIGTYLFFFVWFILGLGLHMQIITLDATVSDRWFYFPIVGLLGMIGIGIKYFWPEVKSNKISKIIILTLLCSTLVLFSYRSFLRSFDFRNDYTLCNNDSRINKNSYIIELCLGNEYRKLKQYDKAISHLNKSIILFPKYYIAMYYLADTYSDLNDIDNALKYYEKTMDNNQWGYGSDKLSTLLAYHRDPKMAKKTAEENLKKQPRNGQLWYALAIAEYRLGNKEKAISAAKNAYVLNPNDLTKKILNGFEKGLSIKFSK